MRRGCIRAAVFAIFVSFLSACSLWERGSPVPSSKTNEATIFGLPNARFFVDRPEAIIAEQERALDVADVAVDRMRDIWIALGPFELESDQDMIHRLEESEPFPFQDQGESA